MMHDYGMMGTQMWLLMALCWGLVIFGLVCLVRWIALHFHHDDGKK